jgi:uncharacterized protein YlxW (UPF0749 family)
MKDLEKELEALKRQLKTLNTQASKARGQTRRRLKRLERRTRVTVARALRKAEPKVRKAVAEAKIIGRGVRVGIKVGTVVYRASRRSKEPIAYG